MTDLVKRQTLTIWIAVLAILFSAFAPAISHALNASGSPSDVMEICTANGVKQVNVPGSNDGGAPVSADHGIKHCAFCATHGGSCALPGGLPAVVAAVADRGFCPPLFDTVPRFGLDWSPANPRAPPRFAHAHGLPRFLAA